ncbi:MAG TPA: hypothetical protein VJI98_06260 [Candidatus Nanoarchaeia archaeon]|nr:hypothetical protein [Candidatus Nanoarchaeia archaeon]
MDTENRNLPIIAGIRDMSPLERESYLSTINNPKGLIQMMSDVYFEPKSFERSGRLYESLGVRYFKKLVMGTMGRLGKKIGKHRFANNYFLGQEDRSVDALKRFDTGTRFNEGVHLFFSLYSSIDAAYNFIVDKPGVAMFMAGLTIFNASSIMLQRYNRARIYNTIEQKLEKVSKTNQ